MTHWVFSHLNCKTLDCCILERSHNPLKSYIPHTPHTETTWGASIFTPEPYYSFEEEQRSISLGVLVCKEPWSARSPMSSIWPEWDECKGGSNALQMGA